MTEAVHSKGSFIYLQIWALGRAAEPRVLKEDGHECVSASNIPFSPESVVPRPLTREEIQEYVQLFAQAAENAIESGFDGVEIQG